MNRGRAQVEVGENVHGMCMIAAPEAKQEKSSGPVDVSAMSAMLAGKWKGGAASSGSASESSPQSEPLRPSQIRTFRITKLDAEKKRVDLELVR